MTANGTIIFNTIVANALDLERNEKYVNYITQNFNKVEKIPFVEGDNELIIIKK